MIENIPQTESPLMVPVTAHEANTNKAKFPITVILILIIVALVSGGAVYFWQQNEIKKLETSPNQETSELEDSDISSDGQAEKQQVSTSPAAIKTKTNSIAMVKNEKVIIKNVDTNEEIDTGIPIRWMDDNATWCTGFNWTPDGSKIIAPGLNKIFDIETKKLSTIKTQNSNILDPSGKYVYYVAYQNGKSDGTWKQDISTSSVEKVSNYAFQSEQFSNPVSPDGNKIIVYKATGIKNKYGSEINKYLVLDMNSKKETEIVTPTDASTVEHSLFDFTWSPSSDALAFVYTLNNNDNKEAIFKTYRTIAVFNLKDSTVEKLKLPFESTRMPKYSPNGKYISFENEDKQGELWKVDNNGQNLIKLSDKTVDFYMPANWSSDSSKVVFTKSNEGVMTINSDGSNKQLVDAKAECAIWSP